MTSRTIESIQQLARERQEQLLERCETLVNHETPSNEPAVFDEPFDYLVDSLEELGFHCRRITGDETGGHLLARPASRERHKPRQLVIGHLDTVWDLGTLEETPFTIHDDGRASGPGLFDMKAGLAQLLTALEIIRELELDLPLTPVVFINSDEEIGSPESTRYIDCLSRMAERCYVLEPAMGSEGKLKTARKGVGHFTVSISGRASHAGISPEEGSSAIVELSHVIQELNQLNEPSRGITVNVGVIEGGTRSNVIASNSRAEVDVRVRDNQQAEEIEQAIRDIEPENPTIELKVEGGFRRPPMEFNDRNRQLWDTVKNQGQKLGLELEHTTSGGASDGNTASQNTSTIDGLGPVGAGAHESHEYIEVDGLVNRTALLSLLLSVSSP